MSVEGKVGHNKYGFPQRMYAAKGVVVFNQCGFNIHVWL
jgi:hypothetical protein